MSTYTFLLLFLLVISFSLPLISSQPCNKADMITLLNIKSSLGNPFELDSWNSDAAMGCCSSWRGVGCGEDGRVTSLGIFYTNVSSPIPPSISDLPALTIINLYNLPNLQGPIPPSIAKLPALAQLTISHTALSGNIPSFLCNLPNLYYLDLSGNGLSGSILPCLMNRLKSNSLPVLSLRENQLTGQIPTSFANVNFSGIDLSNNQLTGNVSSLFGVPAKTSSSLSKINLSWNQFDFDLTSVQFPLSLTQLDLSNNKIWGRIPQQITELKNLTYLDVSYNMLCGPIPKMKQFSDLPLLFQKNKCLCGAPLPPCRRSQSV